MARVGRRPAFVSSLLVLMLGAGASHAQAPQAAEPKKAQPAGEAKKKPDQAPKARAGAKKKSDEQAEGDAAKKQADPAAVQKSLDSAQKALDGGKPDVTVNQINALIGVGGLDSRSMARALSLRGQAYRRQGKPAQAISDLQSALYLRNGLSDAERAAATQARGEAYREAGLGEPPSAGGGKSAGTTPPTPRAGQPDSTPIATATVARPTRPEAPAAQPAPSGGTNSTVGGFFSNLFGGSAQGQKQAAATPAPPTARAPADPAVSSWATAGTPPANAKAASVVATPPPKADAPARPAAPPAAVSVAPARAASPPPPAPAATAPTRTAAAATPAPATATAAGTAPAAASGFRIQLAAMRTREEAIAVAERVKREHGAQVANRPYDIEETRFGNMGLFFRPQFGAFASANEAKGFCATLRAKGIDCLAAN